MHGNECEGTRFGNGQCIGGGYMASMIDENGRPDKLRICTCRSWNKTEWRQRWVANHLSIDVSDRPDPDVLMAHSRTTALWVTGVDTRSEAAAIAGLYPGSSIRLIQAGEIESAYKTRNVQILGIDIRTELKPDYNSLLLSRDMERIIPDPQTSSNIDYIMGGASRGFFKAVFFSSIPFGEFKKKFNLKSSIPEIKAK